MIEWVDREVEGADCSSSESARCWCWGAGRLEGGEGGRMSAGDQEEWHCADTTYAANSDAIFMRFRFRGGKPTRLFVECCLRSLARPSAFSAQPLTASQLSTSLQPLASRSVRSFSEPITFLNTPHYSFTHTAPAQSHPQIPEQFRPFAQAQAEAAPARDLLWEARRSAGCAGELCKGWCLRGGC